MTETIDAQAIRTMTPDALRRWLADYQGWRVIADKKHPDCLAVIAPAGIVWGEGYVGQLDDPTAVEWALFDNCPGYATNLNVAWSLVLEHCAHGGAVNVQIWTRPDGSVLAFDTSASVLSSLRTMETFKVASFEGLTGPVALADALARLAALALLERG